MTYENTPHPDIDASLTAEEAAEKAGYTVGWFRTAMSKLNKAGQDLRAPARPGERARRYDVDKLTAWIEAGKPIPDSLKDTTPDADAHTIQATATHTNGTWTTTLESGATATGRTLRALQANAAALAAQAMELPAAKVRVQLDVQAPGDTGQRWAESSRKQEEGQRLISQAAEERHAVIAELKATGGFTQEDIAAILGISQQRVTQLLQGAAKQ